MGYEYRRESNRAPRSVVSSAKIRRGRFSINDRIISSLIRDFSVDRVPPLQKIQDGISVRLRSVVYFYFYFLFSFFYGLEQYVRAKFLGQTQPTCLCSALFRGQGTNEAISPTRNPLLSYPFPYAFLFLPTSVLYPSLYRSNVKK